MQIAAQRRANVTAAEIGCGGTQFKQRFGLAARPGLGDDLGGLRSDTGQ